MTETREPLPEAHWAALSAATGGDGRRLAALARIALAQGEVAQAYAIARQARAAAPEDSAVTALTSEALSRSVPKWHVPMVREAARNQAYADAIARAVKPEMRVLDIGTGTGLLAMLAARAGAAAVFTCEENPAIADAAEAIIARNGFGDRVKLLRKYSEKIDAEADLGGPVDLIVSEILSSDLLKEGMLPAISDAEKRLLRPGGAMIPQGAEIRVALAHWSGMETALMDDALGFDLTPFNALVPVPHPVAVGDARLKIASLAQSLLDFDFRRSHDYRSGDTRVGFEATSPANGIVQWIRIRLDDDTAYENAPFPGKQSAWFAPFYPLARDVAAGENVTVTARYTRDAVVLWGE